MVSIRDQKLLYHLTSLSNLKSILENGLLSRDRVKEFNDVAEPGIIEFRNESGLNSYVPFHFFCKNPFDGRVQKDYPETDFVYITIKRELARSNNFLIIPKHPKAMEHLNLYSYDEGFNLIDWDLMDERDYMNDECRHICMAECLSPRTVMLDSFFAFYVKNDSIGESVKEHCRDIIGRIPCSVTTNKNMFLG